MTVMSQLTRQLHSAADCGGWDRAGGAQAGRQDGRVAIKEKKGKD